MKLFTQNSLALLQLQKIGSSLWKIVSSIAHH